MSLPKEGSREIKEGLIIAVPHDWCKSCDAAVPYKIWAYQVSAGNLANSVHQTDCRSHVRDSVVLDCYGDDPGQGGGVLSGTHNAECTPKTWSQTVRAEGRNMVRHTDEWWMNHRNTWGILIYIKDLSEYSTPKTPFIIASMYPKIRVDQSSISSSQPYQLAQASAVGVGGSGAGLGGPLTGYWVYMRAKGVAGALVEGISDIRIRRKKCPSQSFCFKGPTSPSQLPEYNKQLTMQNNTLQGLDPCRYLTNRATYRVLGSDQMQAMSASARRQARQNFVNGGGNPNNLAALHCLDMVAGGDPQSICGMGDAAVNSKIGNDWKDVVPKLDKYAEELCADGCSNMQAYLYIC